MIRNEKALIKKAEAGDIRAIKTLARRYDKASGRWTDEPNVGEKVSIEEFFANMEREEKEPCKKKAFEWFMKGAELGDPECMYEVAHRIYDNIGCEERGWPERGELSFEWYLKSAQAGYVPAMRITAYMYAGLVKKNEPESFRWYLKAAELGDKNSIAEVAKYYAKGTGTEKNLAKADEWLAKLSDEDYRSTLHELARFSDDDKIMWLDRLIEFGDALALKYKADVYAEEGKFPEALELYIKAGKGDPPDGYTPIILTEALVQAGNIYYTGDAGEQSDDLALKYYKLAARKKYIKAMVHCGRLLYDLGKLDEAEKYFDYAANHREPFPFVNRINGVAREYMGHICERRGDMAEAYRWYALASEDYNNQAMKLKMADAYFYGDGVPQDVTKALSLYEEAGKYPSHEYFFEARTKLAWIYELGELVDKDSAKAEEHWKELRKRDKEETKHGE